MTGGGIDKSERVDTVKVSKKGFLNSRGEETQREGNRTKTSKNHFGKGNGCEERGKMQGRLQPEILIKEIVKGTAA